jgi:hypothetical protein
MKNHNVLKGPIKQFFCFHNYIQVSNWKELGYFCNESEKPTKVVLESLFRCNKCGKFKRIEI